ncbi:MAG: tetratricopeptide repeat protein [Nibricoccus sp.]
MSASRPAPPKSPANTSANMGHLFGGVVLVLLIVLAYANTFQVPLLFDDEPSIAKNESIRHLATIFSPPKNGEPVTGRPLLNASFALNYALTGLSLPGLHLTNILIHTLAALTLFGVLRRTLKLPALREKFSNSADLFAWFATALWALHPLQTESVTYLSQRAESLVGLFYLLALYSFIRANEVLASRRWLLLTWFVCLAGVSAKEVMVTFPVVALLYERIFLRGSFRECWQHNSRLYLALGSTWLLLAWLVFSGSARGNTVGFAGNVTWWGYLCTQGYAIVRYLVLAVFPSSLSFDYGPLVVKNSAVVALCGALVLALLTATGIAFKRRPALGFFGAWFFLILAPTSSVVPVITQTVAEHRLYLPLAALTTGVTLLLWHCPRKIQFAALGTLVLSSGFITFQRNSTYRSATSLWEDTVAKRPENPRALNNLGLLYVKQKQYDEGIRTLRKVLTLDPGTTETNYNLGYALTRLGRDEEALKYYQAALTAKADNLDALVNYAAALLRLGRIDESMTQNLAALRLAPQQAEAHHNLGQALLRTGRTAEGFDHLYKAVQLAPNDDGFFRVFVSRLLETGRSADAISACEIRLQQNPSADLYTYAGVLYAQNRQLEKARDAFQAALRLDPTHNEATQNLARATALLEKHSSTPSH